MKKIIFENLINFERNSIEEKCVSDISLKQKEETIPKYDTDNQFDVTELH